MRLIATRRRHRPSGGPALRTARRLACAIAILLAGVLVLTACQAPTPSGRDVPTPATSGVATAGDFSGLVTVGTRKLYLECRGTGGPTVILQSGFGNAADIWAYTEGRTPPVYPGTAAFSRVCAYDRPGSTRMLDDAGKPTPSPLPGRSDPVAMPRTGADVVTELHDLLMTAGVSGPYVLAGHSLGGLFQLLYARTYPDEVAGLVLIDATSPAIQQLLTPSQFTKFLQEPLLHPEQPIAGYGFEAYDVERTFQQLGSAAPLPRTPAVVLAAAGLQRGAPPALQKAMGPILANAQAALAASVTGSKLTTVPDTTHYIQLERPDVVIDTIRTVRAG